MNKKLLVVDDNEGILDAVSTILELENYTVKTLSDAQMTLTTVMKFFPDVIILDVLMAGADGREICRQLKKNSKTKHIPILMISAHPGVRESVIESGANMFIEKPFEVDELINTVNNAVSLKE